MTGSNNEIKVVFGVPVPTMEGVKLPPEKAGEKDYGQEKGVVELPVKPNTKELVKKVNGNGKEATK